MGNKFQRRYWLVIGLVILLLGYFNCGCPNGPIGDPVIPPALTPSPTSGPVGTTFTFYLENFAIDREVTVSVSFIETGNVVWRTTVRMDGEGNGEVYFQSDNQSAGKYSIFAIDEIGDSAEAHIEILWAG